MPSPTNCLERFHVAHALLGWSYSFPRESPMIPWLALGIEIGIMLRGERRFIHPSGEDVRYGSKTISAIHLGERYVTQYSGCRGSAAGGTRDVTRFDPRGLVGREIGFIVRIDKDEALRDKGAIVVFPRRILEDARLLDLAHAIADARDRGAALPADTEPELRSFVDRHGDLAPVDALVRAQLELHRHFHKPLYMRHFAEIAGVHEATFGRKFAARFGVTPTRYRTMLRLHEAAALLATHPDLTVADAAARVGFEDVPYFHRAFAARLGLPPLRMARNWSTISPPPPSSSSSSELA